jgi:hypothetical protein
MLNPASTSMISAAPRASQAMGMIFSRLRLPAMELLPFAVPMLVQAGQGR